MAALAEPLVRVFGDAVALALDEAIAVGAVDSWPGPQDAADD